MKIQARGILISFLISVLAFSTLGSAHASVDSSDGFNYTTDGITVTITGCASSCSGALTIPATLSATQDSPVSAIADEAFKGNDFLTSVVLPSTLINIGNSAFEDNFTLTSIVIPATVRTIGARAFYDNRALASLTFETDSQLILIGNQAFQSAAFSSFTIPASLESIGIHVFTSIQTLTSLNVETGNMNFKIENNALLSMDGTIYFAYPCGLSAPNIPDSVTTIESGAFYGNGNISEITIPESVTSIRESAFAGNQSLHSVTFYGQAPAGLLDTLTSMAWDGAVIHYYAHLTSWNEFISDTSLTDPTEPDAVGLVFTAIPTNSYLDGAEFRGKFKVGKKVSLYRGNWDFMSTTTYKFKWYACKKIVSNQSVLVKLPKTCNAISKNISSTYKLKRNAKGRYIAVVVSAISQFGILKVLFGSRKKVS